MHLVVGIMDQEKDLHADITFLQSFRTEVQQNAVSINMNPMVQLPKV